MTNCIQKATYDKKNEILYLHLTPTPATNSYGAEDDGILVVMRDLDTDLITGLTVFYPRKNRATVEKELHELGFDINLNAYLQ